MENQNNYNKEKNKRNPTTNNELFKKALLIAQQKFDNLIKNSKNFKDNIVQKVLDENIYVLSLYKKKKYSNTYGDIFKKNSEEKNYTIKSTNTNDNFSDKNLNQILKSNSNKKIKNSYPGNDIISNNNENYLNIKSNEETKKINCNDICQNIFKKVSNLDGISKRINISNDRKDNNLSLNITSNINVNNYNENNMMIGKKRYPDEKTEKDYLYDKIKKLYERYGNLIKNNNIKEEKENKIYEDKKGFFEKVDLLIIEDKPICIVYLNRSFIYKIYLIVDEICVEEDKEIIHVLNNIKKDLNELIEEKKKIYKI